MTRIHSCRFHNVLKRIGMIACFSLLSMTYFSSCRHSNSISETASGSLDSEKKSAWWEPSVFYQVYPRSFQDSNHDGVGDFAGITQRLDYLQDLGVDAVWLSPIFPSPMLDAGYDISDFNGVDSIYGSMAEFDRMVDEAHKRGMKVLLDLVPNHSSHLHPWFEESRSSRTNPKRDWYVWRNPRPDGSPPNNWISNFGGSAWEFDKTTGQYYYHAFLREQPDLNWRNPEVQKAVFDVIRFWLARKVDGFRVDAPLMMLEDTEMRDNPPNPAYRPNIDEAQARYIRRYTRGLPEMHDLFVKFRKVFDEYPNALFIGETYLPTNDLIKYYGVNEPEAHLPFNFQLISTPWQAPALKTLISDYDAKVPAGAWPNWVMGNHDKSRIASRLGAKQARVAAVLMLTLRGTPTIYQGEEIGLEDVPVPADKVRDNFEKTDPGHGRDPERTPMRWDASLKAGFTTGEPWLPIWPEQFGADAERIKALNVATQKAEPSSMLSLYRDLLKLRRSSPALALGSFRLEESNQNVLAYTRQNGSDVYRIVLNLTSMPQTYNFTDGQGSVVISTHPNSVNSQVQGTIRLQADEGIVVRVN